ncbi:bifunctional folylpolyglutamate synthase/dihydrofolate synthase [Rufibacter sp. H-1]|uniref:Dihydrofolate synthase/folylpolyglutamate synthase n=2 Tax=Rufibacter sediminis TaxID=2762756 RepID=A0ABR6VRB3_9BACT|nr:folylpolyglutamate synthase/dihydrofolate synthase family protein [Rufibacter sediminis]MBC3539746.1 bifunctional folylpolyglutamate synthase/dihydrofolate synthase [Rufibacter sediminis]
MFHRIGNAAFKKSLDNILALTAALDNPQHKFKTVHVGGTNGKGSSSSMLAAILQAAGYKTGLYTSPHLKEFTERIRVNGEMISREKVASFTQQHQTLFEEVKPSFFEMTVALAFDYFVEEQIDIAIIEVGLGGRLDSTNIITPLVSLITNIGLDHQALLGNTVQEIAAEKAGIIKPGVPAVISRTQESVSGIFEQKSLETESLLIFAEQAYKVEFLQASGLSSYYTVYKGDTVYLDQLELSLLGSYQRFNLPGVLATVDQLNQQGYQISEDQLRAGLRDVQGLTGLKGRWQILGHQPLMICDTGHNVDGLREVILQLLAMQPKQVHFVFGAVNDKDIQSVLRLLPVSYRYYFCEAQIPRALPVHKLWEEAQFAGLKGAAYPTVEDALLAAKAFAQEDEVIFIGGSTFVVAEIADL